MTKWFESRIDINANQSGGGCMLEHNSFLGPITKCNFTLRRQATVTKKKLDQAIKMSCLLKKCHSIPPCGEKVNQPTKQLDSVINARLVFAISLNDHTNKTTHYVPSHECDSVQDAIFWSLLVAGGNLLVPFYDMLL